MPLPTFPVIFLDGKTPVPADKTCYIVAQNGTFVQQVTPYFTRTARVKEISILDPYHESVQSRLPPIPARVMMQARMFFRKVFALYRAESILLLYVNDTTGQWELNCPAQAVSYTSVDYNKTPTPISGRRLQGTIHSHCDFGAGHSSTDTEDEVNFNGLHLTMGHVDKNEFSLVSSFTAHSSRFPVDPRTVAAGLSTFFDHNRYSAEPKYRIDLTDEEVAEIVNNDIDLVDEWMANVTPKYAQEKIGFQYGKKRRYQPPLWGRWVPDRPATPIIVPQDSPWLDLMKETEQSSVQEHSH